MKVIKPTFFRENMKECMDLAWSGEALVIPRSFKKNVVIISEEAYSRLTAGAGGHRGGIPVDGEVCKTYGVDAK